MRKKKVTKFIVVFTVFCIQAVFLLALFRERVGHHYAMFVVLVSLLLLLLVYTRLPIHHSDFSRENMRLTIWVPISAVVTYYVNNELGLGPVLALGIVGTVGSYLSLFNTRSLYLRQIASPIYCGAFIGMSSIHVTYVYLLIAVAGMFAGLLFSLTKSLFVGIGGKLGTLAFIGVILSVLLFRLFMS